MVMVKTLLVSRIIAIFKQIKVTKRHRHISWRAQSARLILEKAMRICPQSMSASSPGPANTSETTMPSGLDGVINLEEFFT